MRGNYIGRVFFFAIAGNLLVWVGASAQGVTSADKQGAAGPGGQASSASLKLPYKSKAGTIVSGLGGVVTATQQPIQANWLTLYRTQLLRDAMQFKLMKALASSDKKFSPFNIADEDHYPKAKPTASAILCSGRGDYEVLLSKAAYLNTVTGTLDKYTQPVKSSSVIEAFANVFSTNAIKIPDKALKSSEVVKNCQEDLDGDWPKTYYSQPGIPAFLTLSGGGGALSLIPFSQVSTIFDVLQNIFDFAFEIENQVRANKYLLEHKDELIKAANDLVASESQLVPKIKDYAIGQFVDKVSVLTALQVDAAHIDDCVPGLTAPVSGTNAAQGKDQFVSCYAQLWQQSAEDVQGVINAAAQYDALADMTPDADKKLKSALADLEKNLNLLAENNDVVDVNALFGDAVQIITYAQQIQKALSPSTTSSAAK